MRRYGMRKEDGRNANKKGGKHAVKISYEGKAESGNKRTGKRT